MSENKIESLKIQMDQIKRGPIRHEQIPAPLMPVLRWCHRNLCHLTTPTFEEFEMDFCRDTDPAGQIAIWARMTWACCDFVRRHPAKTKLDVMHDLLTQGPKKLTVAEFEEAKRLYMNPPSEMEDPSNGMFTCDL